MAFLFPETCAHGHLREGGMKVLGQSSKHQLGGLETEMDHLSAQEVRSPPEGLSQLLGIPGLLGGVSPGSRPIIA